MKSCKSMLVLALGIATVDARADWTIVDPAPVDVTPGTSGTSIITITPTVSGTIKPVVPETIFVTAPGAIWLIPGVPAITGLHPLQTEANPFTAWSSTPSVSSFTAGTSFEDVVSWTVAADAAPGDYTFDVTLRYGSHIIANTKSLGSFMVDVVPAPEPGQFAAGMALLGVGGLAFAGRRLLKKPAVLTAND